MDKLTIDEVIEHCEKTVKLENNLIIKGRRCGGKVQYTKRYLEHLQVGEWLKELKQYKDLEEQGLLLKLPCKVGDTVYSITRDFISEYNIRNFICYDNGNIFFDWKCVKGIYLNIKGFHIDDIGKTAFLTKEEAEKALERLECAE